MTDNNTALETPNEENESGMSPIAFVATVAAVAGGSIVAYTGARYLYRKIKDRNVEVITDLPEKK